MSEMEFRDPMAYLMHSKWRFNKHTLDLEFTIGNKYINSTAIISRPDLIEYGTYGNKKYYSVIMGCLENIINKMKGFKSYKDIDDCINLMWVLWLLGVSKYELQKEEPEGQPSLQEEA